MKMSGPAPMSPSTSPDSTVSPGGSASAPAGMVSGEGGHLNTGTTPVYNMAGPQGPPLVLGPGLSSSSDPLQSSGRGCDPCKGLETMATTPLVFHQVPVLTQSGFQQHHCLTGSLGTTGQES